MAKKLRLGKKAREVYESRYDTIHCFTFTCERERKEFHVAVRKFGGHSVTVRRNILEYTKMYCYRCGTEGIAEEDPNHDWCRCNDANKGRDVRYTERIEWRGTVKASKEPFPECTCSRCIGPILAILPVPISEEIIEYYSG